MKKYFVYLLKKNLIPLACLTLFCLLLYVMPIAGTDYSYWNTIGWSEQYHSYLDSGLHYSSILTALALISMFVPTYLFSYKMDKRSVDMYYSLPLNKTHILTVNFLVGLIMIYAPYTVAYLWGFILIAAKVQRLYLIYYLYIYLASIIPAFIIYAITSFMFTRANTRRDGISAVIGAMCLPALAIVTISALLSSYDWNPSGMLNASVFAFGPLAKVTSALGGAIKTGEVSGWFNPDSSSFTKSRDTWELIYSILWLLVAVAATVGLILGEKKTKAENCKQISESIFCYKVQIPIYMTLLSILGSVGGLPSMLMIAFFAYIASIGYKRSPKIGWKFAIVLGSCIIGGFLIGVIFLYNSILFQLGSLL